MFKKNVKKLLFGLLLFLMILPCAKAEGIENFYVSATVLDNGDVEVEEYFNLTGSYNGFERIIKYANMDTYDFNPDLDYYGSSTLYNGTDIILESIKAVDVDSNFNFSNVEGKEFKKVSSSKAEVGDYGVYVINTTSGGEKYKIFMPSKKKKAFYIKYKLVNMAVLNEDVGELFWNIFSKELNEDVDNLYITVTIPNNTSKLRVWAHGPLNGEVKKEGNKLIAQVSNLSKYTAVDIRVTFDKEAIINSPKKSNVIALPKILNYEEVVANQANYEREQLELSKEKKALEEIEDLKLDPTFSNYDRAYNYTQELKNQEVKKEYLNRIVSLYPTVVSKMKQEAENYLLKAETEKQKTYYENAARKIEELQRRNIDTSLLNRLEKLKEEMIDIDKVKEKNNIIKTTILGLISIVIFIFIKCLYEKRFTKHFDNKYFRDIDKESTPSIVSYLFNKKITNDAVSAEILHLINKKVILYEKLDKNDYKLIINNDYQGITSYKEKNLIEVIFGGSNSITLKQIKSKAKKSYTNLYNNYQRFIRSATNEATARGYYEIKKSNLNKQLDAFLVISIFLLVLIPPLGIFLFIIFFIKKLVTKKSKITVKSIYKLFLCLMILYEILSIILIFVYNSFIYYSIILNLIVILILVILIIKTSNLTKITNDGAIARDKWIAFKNFLNDFSRFDEKDLPEVSLWGEYLAYATVLGCAKKLQKVMKIKLEEMHEIENDIINVSSLYSINNLISNSVSKSVKEATTTYNYHTYSSSSSSSSGGGGGFSSGGGSGGGGGGGGRF